MIGTNDVIYTAGLFDGEGSAGIRCCCKRFPSPNYTVECSIANTHYSTINWLSDTFGGAIYQVNTTQYATRKDYKDAWQCRWSGVKATGFLRLIQPYSRIKSEIIKVCLSFPFVGVGGDRTEAQKELLKQLVLRTRVLNRRGRSCV